MSLTDPNMQDMMQVCRNGHVITDLLRTCPDRASTHCHRCGAVTIDRCSTCGHEMFGASIVPGLQPVGVRQAPAHCEWCGAAFPWTKHRLAPKREAVVVLEDMLRRLPLVIRQLRVRHGDRPPFRVVDEQDLEDLVRSLLPLHFENVRPECRTPRYASATRTDYLLASDGIALTLKQAQRRILEQVAEDVTYYRAKRKCRTLVVFVYDPEASLREPCLPATTGIDGDEVLDVRCVVAV